MPWTAIVNPAAGRGRTQRLLPALEAALRAHGAEMHVAANADDGVAVAREALERGRGIVACGGDGTVSELAAAVGDAHGALAVVPTGAGNDFARHLGIDPRSPLDAVDLLTEPRLGIVDLGRARAADGSTAVFTTIANTGFDADANRWANDISWATGTPLYVLAMLRTLARYRPQPVRVQTDDETWEGDAWLVAVGNTRYYAGGMMITPGAAIDDGALDVCIVGATSVGEFLLRFPRVFKGTHTSVASVHTMRGASVAVEPRGGDVPLELWAAGERIGPLPASVEVWPAALRVAVPEGAPVRLS